MTMIEKPFFLVGAERSGTTVLRLMLDHHSSIVWQQEFEYSVDLITDDGVFPSLTFYKEYLECDRIFRATGFTFDEKLDYPSLVDSFLRQKLESRQKRVIGATVHRHFHRLLYIWPDAQFIHIIRDPRDVARSCIGMGWAGNVWYGVGEWVKVEKLWDKLKNQLTSDRYIEIKYEDLIKNPTATLTEICQFMGLSFDDAMLTYDQDTTYSLLDPKLIKQWQKKLSSEEIQLVESKVKDLLSSRGYELSGLPTLEITPMMRQKLKFQNWWLKLQFRINYFGLSLVISDYFSRKLGLKSWQKEIKLKMDQIVIKNLK